MSILDEIATLKKQLDEKMAAAAVELRAQKSGVIAEILAHMKENSVSIRELSDAALVASSKYSSGTKTWSGKGKQPEWLVKGIAAGATLDSFLTHKAPAAEVPAA
jgi:DNA-binding protein H-NS